MYSGYYKINALFMNLINRTNKGDNIQSKENVKI